MSHILQCLNLDFYCGTKPTGFFLTFTKDLYCGNPFWRKESNGIHLFLRERFKVIQHVSST